MKDRTFWTLEKVSSAPLAHLGNVVLARRRVGGSDARLYFTYRQRGGAKIRGNPEVATALEIAVFGAPPTENERPALGDLIVVPEERAPKGDSFLFLEVLAPVGVTVLGPGSIVTVIDG